MKKYLAYDSLTPVMLFQAVGGSCLLESAYEKGEGKTSYIGVGPLNTFQGNSYEDLKKLALGKRVFGLISYDAIRLKEKIPDRHVKEGIPDLLFHTYKTVFTFYHDQQKLVCTHEGSEEELEELLRKFQDPICLKPLKGPKKVDILPDICNEEFVKLVERAQEYIRAGDIFQVVLSRTFQAEIKARPFDVYRALRVTSPAPYHFFFEEEGFAVAGASPELMLSVHEGKIESMPIAGTLPKNKSIQTLLECPKESAEHVMLVDLARNDVGALAKAGSVHVAEYKSVKTFSHVHHIVSRVVGELEEGFHPLDAFKSSFPAGTLSGAPKIRAMEIIDELENSRRNLYGGAVVTIDENGNLLSAIAIRMAIIRGSRVEVRAGAGIVLDSIGQKEAEETEHKARGILEAIQLAEGSV